MGNDMKSLSHTKWKCKYHIVFAPKHRRKVFFGEKKVEIGKILRKLCEWKDIIGLYSHMKYPQLCWGIFMIHYKSRLSHGHCLLSLHSSRLSPE